MRTDDLIGALVADTASVSPPISRTLAIYLAAGVALTSAAFLAYIGPRTDIAEASQTGRFLFKFLVTLSLAIPAIGLSARLARPGASAGNWGWALLAAPVLLAVAVIAELYLLPSSAWAMRMYGKNATMCLTIIPALSVPVLVLLLLALRQGAPTRPGVAGAVSGLVAAGIAATLYAANCTDDSPLFVAAWYPVATGIAALAGGLIGARLLRW